MTLGVQARSHSSGTKRPSMPMALIFMVHRNLVLDDVWKIGYSLRPAKPDDCLIRLLLRLAEGGNFACTTDETPAAQKAR